MQASTMLLCLLLIAAAFSSHVLASPDGVKTPTCCYRACKIRIPVERLESYTRTTSSHCPWEAVIFRTKRGKETCADLRQKWVQDAVEYLDKQSRNPTP